MNIEFKQKAITLAREIHEAMETLNIATGQMDEAVSIEAKNIVANVLRSHKRLIESMSGSDQEEAQKIFHRKIEAMALKARGLN